MLDLSHYGEDVVVARLTALLESGPGLVTGPGDDCAVVEGAGRGQVELLKTDCLICGVHFLPSAPPGKVGWKAVECRMRWVEEVYRGMNKCARAFDCSIVGGETSSLPSGAPVMISVAGTGSARRSQVVLRSGGRSGDLLFVTGRLGGSQRGRHLSFMPRVVEADWLSRNFRVRAMMDLSDGLAMDLPRLASASGCGFRLREEALPRSRGVTVAEALSDGEDYELLLAISERSSQRLIADWPERFPGVKLTCIGELSAEGLEGLEGLEELPGGWDHFREQA